MENPCSPLLLHRIDRPKYIIPNDELTETYRDMGFSDDAIAWHRKLHDAPNWTYQEFKSKVSIFTKCTTCSLYSGDYNDDSDDEDQWEEIDYRDPFSRHLEILDRIYLCKTRASRASFATRNSPRRT